MSATDGTGSVTAAVMLAVDRHPLLTLARDAMGSQLSPEIAGGFRGHVVHGHGCGRRSLVGQRLAPTHVVVGGIWVQVDGGDLGL